MLPLFKSGLNSKWPPEVTLHSSCLPTTNVSFLVVTWDLPGWMQCVNYIQKCIYFTQWSWHLNLYFTADSAQTQDILVCPINLISFVDIHQLFYFTPAAHFISNSILVVKNKENFTLRHVFLLPEHRKMVHMALTCCSFYLRRDIPVCTIGREKVLFLM